MSKNAPPPADSTRPRRRSIPPLRNHASTLPHPPPRVNIKYIQKKARSFLPPGGAGLVGGICRAEPDFACAAGALRIPSPGSPQIAGSWANTPASWTAAALCHFRSPAPAACNLPSSILLLNYPRLPWRLPSLYRFVLGAWYLERCVFIPPIRHFPCVPTAPPARCFPSAIGA